MPVATALISSSVEADGVHLAWMTDVSSSVSFDVQRSDDGAVWQTLALAAPDGLGHVSFVDHSVVAGARVAYRLWDGRSGTSPAWVTIPESARFGIVGSGPGVVTGGAISVSFSLPGAQPATLALLDVSGRLIAQQPVGSLGGREHAVTLAGEHLRSGIYYIRLSQGAMSASRGVVVAR